MKTIIQQASQASEREYQNRQGLGGAFEGTIVEVNPQSDTVGIDYGPTANRRMPAIHPFVGSNSWIRSQPEVGARVLMQTRFDSGSPEIVKTLPISGSDRTQGYFNQQNLYRDLGPGEHDFSSSGFASLYMSRRGHQDQYAGSGVSSHMDRDRLEIRRQAPTLREQNLYWTAGKLGDETRTGIVKRWTSAVDETYIQDNQNFQTERFFSLLNPADQAPLIRITEGHVYGDDGVKIQQFATKNDLRHQSLYYTNTGEFVRREFDVNGNLIEVYPEVATIGREVRIPAGSDTYVIGVDRDVQIQRDEKIIVGRDIQYTVGNTVSYDVKKAWNATAGKASMVMSETAAGMVLAGSQNVLGFQAQDGSMNVFGPDGSGLFFSGGKTLLNDSQSNGLMFDGSTATIFTQTGSFASIGSQINLGVGTGNDTISIAPNAVQILSGGSVSITAKTLGLTVGSIFLGVNAAIPAVLGLNLLNFLDTHIHTATAEGAPTTPAIVPASSFIGTPLSILSISSFLSPSI